jgi:hypothetical protein
MAKSNTNTVYVEWNSIDISGDFTGTLSIDRTNATQDVTAGSGATDIQRNAGLNDTKLGVQIRYDDDEAERDLWLPVLKPGTKATLIIVPGGRTSGNPVHEQVCIIASSVGPNIDITKAPLMLDLKFDAADVPVRNFNDDKWP